MTGQELLAQLQKMKPADLALPLQTEGCDCWGDVGAVGVDGNSLCLYRPEREKWEPTPEQRAESERFQKEMGERADKAEVRAIRRRAAGFPGYDPAQEAAADAAVFGPKDKLP